MADKEKIEIDGVDVSGCSYYNPLGNYNCGGTKKCSQWSNCYFKQLNRKTAECEKYEQALGEIENISNKNNRNFNFNNLIQTIQLVNDFINDFKRIKDIISKAKDGKNE